MLLLHGMLLHTLKRICSAIRTKAQNAVWIQRSTLAQEQLQQHFRNKQRAAANITNL
jgi:hypothetical protein